MRIRLWEKLDQCTVYTVLYLRLLADHFDVSVTRQLQKQVIKSEVLSILLDKGVLSCAAVLPVVS